MSVILSLTVPDISCEGCANSVKAALRDVLGVEDVQVNVASKTVRVTHSPESGSEAIRQVLSDAGFPPA